GDLGARAEVSWYTTSVAVQDLERVRAALGYERINLYGTSYGTRVAQHYLRRFPERVRAVILDGVVPAPLALGPEVALDAERSLLDILARRAVPPGRARLCRSRRDRHARQRGVHGGRALLSRERARAHAPRRHLPRHRAARWPGDRVPHLAARCDRPRFPRAAHERGAG